MHANSLMTEKRFSLNNPPQGVDFLNLVWEQEEECFNYTRQKLPEMGEKVPECLSNLGTVLSLLDQLASCLWGCSEGDHLIEYLAGRASSSTRASVRLLYAGFYDEALMLTRGIGEIANLLFLFSADTESMNLWRRSDKGDRQRHFTPFRIRVRLEELGVPPIIDKERYSRLSEIGTHVTPETKPQCHNPIGQPTLGGVFQEGGVVVALNEVCSSISLVALPLTMLLDLDRENEKDLIDASERLLINIGAVDVLSVQKVWDDITSKEP